MNKEMHLLSLRPVTEATAAFLISAGSWLYPWWGEPEGYSREEVRTMMENSCEKQRFPRTYGLYFGETLIGMFQFTLSDMDIRPNIYPWLANLFIDPAYREKGYSEFLIRSVQAEAERAGLQELFLYTAHVGLYERYGWEFVGEIDTFRKTPRMQRLYRLKIK